MPDGRLHGLLVGSVSMSAKHPRRWLAPVLGLAPLALVSAGCLGYPVEGAVGTPVPPGQDNQTRLPQLLQQLQGAGAGLELFDATPSSQVLAAQDEQGKGNASPAGTVAGTRTPTSIAQVPGATTTTTPAGGGSTPTATSIPTDTPGEPSDATPTPTPTSTATTTPTASPTPTEAASPPTEGGSLVPPTE